MLRYLRFLVMDRIGTALILCGSCCIVAGRGLLQRIDAEIERDAHEAARLACT